MAYEEHELTLRHALDYKFLGAVEPDNITPTAQIDRKIRWVHVIGQDKPGELLEGGELILSTLPRMTEDRVDLAHVLEEYLSDLDRVSSTALVLEVLTDRPRLREILLRLAAQREQRKDAKYLTPILLFSHVVRFVEITEQIHRELVSRQFEDQGPPVWNPRLILATNLLEDLASEGSLPYGEIERRAASLGVPHKSYYTALVFRATGASKEVSEARVAALANIVQEAGRKTGIPSLVAAGSELEFNVLISSSTKTVQLDLVQRFCKSVADLAVYKKSSEILPQYVVAASSSAGTLANSPRALEKVAGIARTASKIVGMSQQNVYVPHTVQSNGFWRAEDFGLEGILVHLIDESAINWFLEHYLAPFKSEEHKELRRLVQVAMRTSGNKAELARELNLSRPTLYARLHRIEKLLGKPLDGATLSLMHAALTLERLKNRA